MPIAPAPQIAGQTTWQPVDTSGVQFDPSKLQTMPNSLFETEGFRFHLDSEHGWEITRVFRCNWSDVMAVAQWAVGYSLMLDQRTLNAKAFSPNGQPPTSQPQGPSSHTLSRVVPLQDWYLPSFYVGRVELVECLGVPLSDPGSYLKDINGQNIDITGTAGGGNILKTVGEQGGPPMLQFGVGPVSQLANDNIWEGELYSFQGRGGVAYDADILWGDGTAAQHVAELDDQGGQVYVVGAAHAYATAGQYTVTIVIFGSDESATTTTVTVAVGPEFSVSAAGQIIAEPVSASVPQAQVKQRLPGLVFAEQPAPGVFSEGVATLRFTYWQRPYVVRNDTQNTANNQGELGRYVQWLPKYAIQGLPLYNIATAGALKFANSNNLIPEPGSLLIPTSSWVLRWHDVPFYPQQQIANLVGRVNSKPFGGVSGWPTFPAGQLLCMPPEIRMQRNAAGQPAFTIDFMLDQREAGGKGWNGFLNAASTPPTWQYATFGGGDPDLDAGSNMVFQLADFNDPNTGLFAVGQTFAFV